MKFSKVALGALFCVSFALFANVSFAKAKDVDGEIVAYMQAINNSEINTSQLAKDKKVDETVAAYADMMVQQHSDNLKQVTDLSQKLNIAADETSSVKKFKEDSKKDLKKLSDLTDNQFQKAYIKAMIKGHTKANTLLSKFEKEVQNDELKNYLVETKAAVEKHLAEAKDLK